MYRYEIQTNKTNALQSGLNAFSTMSNLKTARLAREEKERALEKDRAGESLVKDDETIKENVLIKERNETLKDTAQIESDITGFSEDPEDWKEPKSPEYEEELNTLSVRERINAISKNPKVAKRLEKEAKDKALVSSLTKFYESRGLTKQESYLKANGFNEDIRKFEEDYAKSDDRKKKNYRDGQAQQGKAIDGILTMSKENPQGANKQFLDFRTSQEDRIKQFYKNGNVEAGDTLQKELDKIPKTLLGQDGKFNAEFLVMELAKIDSKLTSAESYDKENIAKTKTQDDIKKSTTKHLRKQPKVITQGDKDIKLTPTKKGWKEKETTSNALLKEQAKGGSGGAKTSDFSLVEKIAIRNTTGLDLDNPDDMAKFADLSQDQRDVYTKLSARASRIYKDGGGKITHAEAVEKASKEKSRSKKPVEGKLYKKNGKMYKIVNGKPVEQK